MLVREVFYSDLVNAVEAAGGYNDQTYMQVVHNMANTLTGNFGGGSALTEGLLLQVILPNDMLKSAVAQEHDQIVGEFATASAIIGINTRNFRVMNNPRLSGYTRFNTDGIGSIEDTFEQLTGRRPVGNTDQLVTDQVEVYYRNWSSKGGE